MLTRSTKLNSVFRVSRIAKRSYAVLSPKPLSSTPISISVSPDEVASKCLNSHNLELATRALHRDGLVVLKDVIEHSKLDRLNEKMVEDAMILQSAGDDSPFNYNKGNIQQDPPLTSSHWDSTILLNPLATHLTTSLLGPKPRLSFISANTALPPTPTSPPLSQPVHSDADFAHPDCPFALVVNVPLVTMTPSNGSTEIWLGTHISSSLADQQGEHGSRASGRIKTELLEARRKVRPPVQAVVEKGSVIVRDLRLWHAGKPNLEGQSRVMLAMIHFAPWFRNAMRVEISSDLQPVIERDGGDLQIQAEFIPEQEVLDRYLKRGYGNAYNFDQVDHLPQGVF